MAQPTAEKKKQGFKVKWWHYVVAIPIVLVAWCVISFLWFLAFERKTGPSTPAVSHFGKFPK